MIGGPPHHIFEWRTGLISIELSTWLFLHVNSFQHPPHLHSIVLNPPEVHPLSGLNHNASCLVCLHLPCFEFIPSLGGALTVLEMCQKQCARVPEHDTKPSCHHSKCYSWWSWVYQRMELKERDMLWWVVCRNKQWNVDENQEECAGTCRDAIESVWELYSKQERLKPARVRFNTLRNSVLCGNQQSDIDENDTVKFSIVWIGMSWNRCESVPRANCEPVQLLGHKSRGSMPNALKRWRMQSRGQGS